MIISFSGEPGSGKTQTVIRLMELETIKGHKIYHNMRGLKGEWSKNAIRIRREWVFKKLVDEVRSTERTTKYKLEPDWDYWEQNKGCSFMLDEVHNFIDATEFQTKEGKCGSKMIAQIRKITEDTGNFEKLRKVKKLRNYYFKKFIYDVLSNHNNFYMASQTYSRINKNFRDLSQVHIHCSSKHFSGLMLVTNYFYFSDAVCSASDNFITGRQKPKIAKFWSNKYFDMYSKDKLVRPEEEFL